MSKDENKRIILLWLDAVNRGDIQLLDKLADELFSPNFIAHNPIMPGFEPGPAGVKKFIHRLLQEHTSFHITVEDVFAYDDKTANRVTMSMTEAASGKLVNLHLLAITRFVNDQIAEVNLIGEPEK